MRIDGHMLETALSASAATLVVIATGGCQEMREIVGTAYSEASIAATNSPSIHAAEISESESANGSESGGTDSDAVTGTGEELLWSYGGFDGSRASQTADAEIASLKISEGGLSYSWVRGGCEELGASSRTDAACIACLFVYDGKTWRGGKFDWISTSRTRRDFANIRSGYNGWPPDAVGAAKAYRFCIVSKNGRKRTNIVEAGK